MRARLSSPSFFRALSSIGALGALCLSLAAAACGGDGGSPGGGGSTSSTTGATSSSTSTSSATGSGGGGGAPAVKPSMTLTKINEPAWEFADFHQGTFAVGLTWDNTEAVLGALVPPPNHKYYPDLGIGPGAAHASPYTSEISESYGQQKWKNSSTFLTAEALLPNCVIGVWMVVPSAGSPTGKSPDGDATTIIPNTLFPMAFASEDFADGVKVLGSDSGFEIPPMDENVDPAFAGVEGHSHYPLFSFRYLDGETTIAGAHERRGSVVDAGGAGWKFTIGFQAVE